MIIPEFKIGELVRISRPECSYVLNDWKGSYEVPVARVEEDFYAGFKTVKILLNFEATKLGKSFSAWFVFDTEGKCWRKRRPYPGGAVCLSQIPFVIAPI